MPSCNPTFQSSVAHDRDLENLQAKLVRGACERFLGGRSDCLGMEEAVIMPDLTSQSENRQSLSGG